MQANNQKEVHQIPPCKYYDDCGGCSMQHLTAERYYEIKEGAISEIVSKFGNNKTKILSLGKIQEYNRRRVEFKISARKNEVSVGFFQHKTHNIINIAECIIAEKEISTLIEPLKNFIKTIKKPSNIVGASITKLQSGLDIILKVNKKPVFNNEETQNFINNNNIKRLYISVENVEMTKIFDDESSSVKFDDVESKIPLNTFLQATERGQRYIFDFIKDNISTAKNIADLYSGCGTYSLPLLNKGLHISAFEGNPDMVASLLNNAKRLGFDSCCNVEIRDLFKNPLPPQNLNHFDLAIINPPRAGAERQVKKITESNLKKLIYISCDRKSFENDLKILQKSGFKLNIIKGIDQFYWSKHIEIAALIER